MKIPNTLKLVLFFQLCFLISIVAQDMQQSLFGEVDKKMEEAKSSNLKLLSPSNFEKALNNYNEAKDEFKSGANLKDIQEKISDVIKFLDAAKEKSEVSNITLKNSLKARGDALKVSADLNAPDLWKQAEDKFRDAGEEVEDGDIPSAEDYSKEAEDLFKSAELKSIKTMYLDETWRLIDAAKEDDADSYSPKILAKATKLANDAAKELTNNRYDTDVPRSLAQQAKYEAEHAIYYTKFIKNFEDSDKSLEDLLLSYEDPIKKITEHFDYEAKFNQPIEKVINEIVQKIVDLKLELEKSQQNNMDLTDEVKILKEELGGVSKEKSELSAKMQKLAEIKAKYEKIQNSFGKNEADIFREGNNIYIRLVSLNFPVGKSIIEPVNYPLLAKVQNAIKEFPNCTVVVEGHTDSYGSDRKNMELSQERASSVKQYLLANMNLDPTKVKAFGYGETKPIASNDTKEGRAKNRRIDLIIKNAE